MKAFLLAVLSLAIAAPALAQLQAQAVTPPIPIIKQSVGNIVDEQAALVLTPEQIEKLKLGPARARQQMITPYPQNKIAKPVVRSITIEPDSTRQPTHVRLAMGSISALVFSDSNGNPWFVRSVSLDCNSFTDGVSCGEQSGGNDKRSPTNIVKLQPKLMYAYGNIVIELEELGSPVILLLSAGSADEVDIQLNARVIGRNPNAKPQIIAMDRIPEADSAMGAFLDGVPPSGATRMKVGGGSAEAWTLGGKLYLRTRYALLSPAFINHVGSADGMHIYAFDRVYPSLLVSINGKGSSLSITGN